MLQFVVQKSFEGAEGRVFQTGELVDAENWRNRESLIRGRYLRVATADEIASAVDVPDTFVTAKKKPVAKRRAA